TKPPEPKAEVKLLDPADDKTVKEADYTVRFNVRSKSPLRKVVLMRDKDVVFSSDKLTALELEKSQAVTLVRGLNTFFVIAENEGGEQATRPVVVNYQHTPVVRIVFDRLESGQDVSNPAGEPHNGEVPFARVQAARQAVLGHVIWDKENDEQMAKVATI